MQALMPPMIACLLCIGLCHAQPPQTTDRKYGHVKAEDFIPTVYAVDSNANAIYLLDEGESHFTGNSSGFFSLQYTRHSRIRILHKSGFDVATIDIPLYIGSTHAQEEKILKWEAATYNIANGKLVKTAVDKKSLYYENGDKQKHGKFTFPDLKEGSIIEYTYQIESPYFSQPNGWYFQGKLPRLWSHYEITIPEYFDFVTISKGYHTYDMDTSFHHQQTFTISQLSTVERASAPLTLTCNSVQRVWEMSNIAPLKTENYITTLDNYIAKLNFQLRSLNLPNQPTEPFMTDWIKQSKILMEDEDFGKELSASNSWMNAKLDEITAHTEGVEEIQKIYAYFRDNFSNINKDRWWKTQSLKKTWETQKGNLADINLLLVAALRKKGFQAYPFLLSTRSNGRSSDLYPIINEYNYTICDVVYQDKTYFLDASDKYLGFNKLNEECYNYAGRQIDQQSPFLLGLVPDSLTERKVSHVIINNEDDSLNATVQSQMGYFESLDFRKSFPTTGKDNYFRKVKNNFNYDVRLDDSKIENMEALDYPVRLNYKAKFKFTDNTLYFVPFLDHQYKENPFKSETRNYPVELPYKIDETYILTMRIPKGYDIEELPRSQRMMLFEDEGMFEYLIVKQEDMVQMRCILQLNKTFFAPDEYETLRQFFAAIVQKEAEPFVLKKHM